MAEEDWADEEAERLFPIDNGTLDREVVARSLRAAAKNFFFVPTIGVVGANPSRFSDFEPQCPVRIPGTDHQCDRLAGHSGHHEHHRVSVFRWA